MRSESAWPSESGCSSETSGDAAGSGTFSVAGVSAMLEALQSARTFPAEAERLAAADSYLTRFQRDPSAWGICISLLRAALQTPSSVSAEAAYFAAQTLAAQARAGFPHQLKAALREGRLEEHFVVLSGVCSAPSVSGVFEHLRDGLIELIFNFRAAQKPVLRQLCIALAGALVYGQVYRHQICGEQRFDLCVVIEALGSRAGGEGFVPLLEFLVLLPEEICAKRLALPENERLACLVGCLSQTSLALDAALSVFAQTQSTASATSPVFWTEAARTAVQAVHAWLSAALHQVQLLEGGDASVPSEVQLSAGGVNGALQVLRDALYKVSSSSLLDCVLAAVVSDDATLLHLSSECVGSVMASAARLLESEAHSASLSPRHAGAATLPDLGVRETEETRVRLRPLLAKVVGVYGAGCSAALSFAESHGGLESCDPERLQMFGQGVVALAKTHLPLLLWRIDLEARSMTEGTWRIQHPEAEIARARAAHSSLRNAADAICAFNLRLLEHSTLSVKEVGLDFFRSLLLHLVLLLEEERRLSEWVDFWSLRRGSDFKAPVQRRLVDEARVKVREEFACRRSLQREVYAAFVDKLPDALMLPSDFFFSSRVASGERFDLEAWIGFREDCFSTLAEAQLVVGIEFTARKHAALLNRILEVAVQKGAFAESTEEWRQMESRIFVLASLASRMWSNVASSFFSSSCKAGGDSEGEGGATASTSTSTGGGSGQGADSRFAFLEEFVIPLLKMVPQLPVLSSRPVDERGCGAEDGVMQEGVAISSLFFVGSLARLIAASAPPLLASPSPLFGSLFEFLATRALPLCAEAAQCGMSSEAREGIAALQRSVETQLVDAVAVLTASSAHWLASSSSGEEDARRVLNALTSLLSREGLSMDARSALLHAAGAVISEFDAPRLRMFLLQLLKSLARNLDAALSEGASVAVERRALQLFFSAVECVRPVAEPPPPPVCLGPFEPLPSDESSRHPVLDVVERVWPTAERALKDARRSEFLFEVSTTGVVTLFSNCRAFAHRYNFFYAFLETFASTFRDYPTVFHLGALRSLAGLYGRAPETFAQKAIETALKTCVEATLSRLQVNEGRYLYEQPDIVGMTFDCVNVALLSAPTARLLLAALWFREFAATVLKGAPNCDHPKVLHTSVVFASRLAAWVDVSESQIRLSLSSGNEAPDPWMAAAIEEAQTSARLLFNEPFVSKPVRGATDDERRGDVFTRSAPRTFLDALVVAVVRSLTNVHSAVQSWVGSAAQTFVTLLQSNTMGEQTRLALERAVAALPTDVCSAMQKREFLRECSAQHASLREMCSLLQRLADDSKAALQRRSFGGVSTEASPEAFV